MSENKHTPAPWVARKAAHGVTDIFDSNNEDICTIYSQSPVRSADARLIAAAPDLLEALRMAANSSGFQYMTHETRDAIEAAIAKARGES